MSRVMFHTNAPWAGSGYGVQAKHFAPLLAQLDHPTAISAFYGLEGGVLTWGGVKVYPRGHQPYGADIGLAHAKHFSADVLVALMDSWVLGPMLAECRQQGLPCALWAPVDQGPPPAVVVQAAHAAAGFWCYSKWGTDEMRKAGIEHARYVPLAVNADVMQPRDQEAAREKLGLPQGKYIVGMVAANKCPYARKAWPQALEAFAKFVQRHPDAHLYLHTETTRTHGGWDVDEIVGRLGIGEHVSVVDRYLFHLGLDDDHMQSVFNAIDVLLSPSYGEGFGVPIIEAQSCGKPVIVGDWTSMPELVRCGAVIARKDATRMQTLQGGFWHVPHVDAIVDALGGVYAQRSNVDAAALHQQIASEYDAKVVLRDQLLPAIESLTPDPLEFPPVAPAVEVSWHGEGEPELSILVPTVEGREATLERCLASYAEHTPVPYELVVVRNRPSCGEAWIDGVPACTGVYLHVTADDIEAHAGWYDAAVACVEGGALPSAWLDLPAGGTDGEVGPDGAPARMTPLPFLKRVDWPGVPPIGYWSDYAVSDRLMAEGHRIVWCHGYRFTHWRHQDAARRHHESRYLADHELYEADRAAFKGKAPA